VWRWPALLTAGHQVLPDPRRELVGPVHPEITGIRQDDPEPGWKLVSMDRRGFLQGAVGLAAAGLAAPHLPTASASPAGASATRTARSILTRPAADCPIDTVVVLMMENRSFDHMLGWLATDSEFLDAGRTRYGPTFHVDGRQHLTYTAPGGAKVSTYHLPSAASDETNPWRGCGHPDPGHGWSNGRTQRDHGFLANGSGNDEYAIGYYGAGDHPCYEQLARNFTTFDRYFASAMTSTYPNRYYLHAAQGDGTQGGSLPIVNGTTGFTFPTIWDRLQARGVSCRYFATDLPVTAFWGTRLLPITSTIADYLVEAEAGTLPHVSFVDPGFLSGMRSDDHPHGDTRTAQALVAAVVGALMRGPQWHRSAVVVTYDEWGGFFDHVRPPVLPDDRATKVDATNWGQAGFRLPVFLASPYAQPGLVDHRTYDHTSILRFIEWRFLGAPAEGSAGRGWWLTKRDRHANNIGASLATTRQTDFELRRGSVPVTISAPCQGDYFQDVPGVGDLERALDPGLRSLGVDLDQLTQPLAGTITPGPGLPLTAGSASDLLPVPDHDLAQAAEPFAALGYRIDPAMSLRELLAQP
jgi:phospholipase C